MLSAFQNAFRIEELRNRIFFTLLMLMVFRLGAHIPTPGIDSTALAEFFRAQEGTIFSFFDMFSGGALQRLTVFALGIMPYISASIIFQLLASVIPTLERLKKEGEAGRQKINQYTRYATVALCLVQGIIMIGTMRAAGGGVAGAISKRGGPSIQRESNAWTADHGPVPTGGAAITGAGDLPARFVIHAVGPIWGTGDEFTKLASAVRAALRLADERGCKSISLPAISAGIYGFPVDLCARTFFDAIESWLKERSGGSVTVVRLCNIDHATAKAFETEARGRYGP